MASAKKPRELLTWAIGLVVIHFIVSIAHGMAHDYLGIGLSFAQKLFVGIVIVAMPIAAAYLLWKRNLRAGGSLLALSMAGAFMFGVYYHFIAPGPDNVNHEFSLIAQKWPSIFEHSAIEIAGLEFLGALFGLVLFLNSSKKTNKTSPTVANHPI